MITVEVEQTLSKSDLYKHRCLENIKNGLCRTIGRCD